ncbi:MAG: CRISPR-associated endonuclease Cas1 [Spirulina sp.]
MNVLFLRFLEAENFRTAWEKVAENHGCAGVDGETIAHFQASQRLYLARLRDSIAKGNYLPLPWRQLWIPKKKGGWRELRIPTVRDRIVQQAMLNVLHPVMEKEFSPVSYAYRPGRSHLMAVRRVGYWRDAGYDWVLDADIVKYFDSLRHKRLLAEVRERLDLPHFLELIEDWITAGVLTKQGLILPQKGVPQGAVISPILANIYLDDFDDLVTASGLKLVRYADDFVVMARTRKRLLAGYSQIEQILEGMGLELHEEKTQITHFDKGFRFLGHAFSGDLIVPTSKIREERAPVMEETGVRLVHSDSLPSASPLQLAMVEALKERREPIPPPLFVVFGYTVREEKPVKIESKESIWRREMATIYLVEQRTKLRKEKGRLIVIPPDEEAIEVPIREVEQILVFGNIQLTSSVMSVCLAENIPVVFLTQLGEYKGHLWCGESRDFEVKLAQFERWGDTDFQLEVSRAIVWGKLMNSKQLLLRLNRKRRLSEVQAAITGITDDVTKMEMANDIDVVRGYEGKSAARYFPAMGRLITHKDFSFSQRNRRPPKDPVNSLLSFGYTLLFENIFSFILAEGLSPYMGNFHYGEKPKPYLAFDLVEEFRSPIVDSLVLTIINKSALKPTDFTWPNEEGGIYLNKQARRVFLKYFENRMSEEVSHPDVKEKVSYRRAIHLQVRRYKRSVRNRVAYEPFLRSI